LRPEALAGVRSKLDAHRQGESRHDLLVKVAPWALREAAAGYYPATDAIELLHDWWIRMMSTGDRHDAQRVNGPEFPEVIAWAVGQVAAEPDRVAADRAEIEAQDDYRRRLYAGELNPLRAPGLAEGVCLPDAHANPKHNWDDTEAGEAFARSLGGGWVYVTPWKRWMRWDGRRWIPDQIEQINETARQWVLDRITAIAQLPGDNGDTLKKIARYKDVNAQERLVRVARRILAVEPDVFDRHPNLLNCGNGVIDLRTGQLVEHDPALRLTKLANADYWPDAQHDDIDAVWSCLDDGNRSSVRQLLGVSATGHSIDLVAVFDGSGANGKTTLLTAVSAALGDYAAPIPTELVMNSRRDEHPHIYETLRGLRLAYVEETDEDGGLRIERVKALTGGASITARPMGGSYYTFEPCHTLVIATNHRPIVNSAEYAIWRRLRLVPFPYRYGTAPGDRPIDRGLRERIRLGKHQRDAMLASIVSGAKEAYDNGDGAVPVIKWSAGIGDATNTWRLSEDAIGRFLADRIVFDPDKRIKATDLFAAWERWCQDENRPAGQQKNFLRRFETHDEAQGRINRIKPQGSVWYTGLHLSPAPIPDSWTKR
jgi:putative DNA primase/helicase